MQQAIGIRKYSACEPKQPSWQARLRRWVLGHPDRRGLIPIDRSSTHLLRDIGLGEGICGSRLLQDHHLFRR